MSVCPSLSLFSPQYLFLGFCNITVSLFSNFVEASSLCYLHTPPENAIKYHHYRTNIVLPQAKLLFVMLASEIRAGVWILATLFPIWLPANLGKTKMVIQVLGSLPRVSANKIGFLALDFSQAQLWMLQSFGKWISKQEISLSPFPSLSPVSLPLSSSFLPPPTFVFSPLSSFLLFGNN